MHVEEEERIALGLVPTVRVVFLDIKKQIGHR